MNALASWTHAIPARPQRFHRERLRSAIQEAYTVVAEQPACEFHFNSGRAAAERLGYTAELLAGVPEGAIASFAGVGNPFQMGSIASGASVLELGSGAGMDAIIAARQCGPRGSVLGVDMTAPMLERARLHARLAGAAGARFEQGYLESLPVADGTIDVVISNGVINLCPDKTEVFREMFRVLAPGGRFQIADILLDRPLPAFVADLVHLWVDCVAGALPMLPYVAMLQEVGFEEVEVTDSFDTFEGASVEARALQCGARGYNVCGRKPRT